MDNKTTGILVIVVLIVVAGGYLWWENTRADGQTTLDQPNPNAPAVSEPANPGGGPMKQTP
jgi:hypothetical protein